MKAKKIICSLILMLCTAFLAGCVNVEYQRLVDDNGVILDKITIELDYDELTKKGYTEEEVLNLLDGVKEELHKYYIVPIENRLKYIQNIDPILYNSIRNKIDIGVATKVIEPEYKIYKASAQIIFQNADIMKTVYGIESDEEETDAGITTVVEPFLTKYMQSSENVFGDVTTLEISGVNFFEKYSQLYPEFTKNDVTLTQIYGTTDSRMHSNADEKANIEGFNCHLWELSIDEAKTFELQFYYLSPTTSTWYQLALVLTAVVLVILLTVYVVKKYNKNKFAEEININDSENQNKQSEE